MEDDKDEETFMDRVNNAEPPDGWDELGVKVFTGIAIVGLIFVLIMLSWLVKFIWNL